MNLFWRLAHLPIQKLFAFNSVFLFLHRRSLLVLPILHSLSLGRGSIWSYPFWPRRFFQVPPHSPATDESIAVSQIHLEDYVHHPRSPTLSLLRHVETSNSIFLSDHLIKVLSLCARVGPLQAIFDASISSEPSCLNNTEKHSEVDVLPTFTHFITRHVYFSGSIGKAEVQIHFQQSYAPVCNRFLRVMPPWCAKCRCGFRHSYSPRSKRWKLGKWLEDAHSRRYHIF